jgi:biopolymer transport protein ExbD
VRRLTPAHGAFEGINATPLIDVVMCLIVFFLLVGKLSMDQQSGLRLPEAISGDTATVGDKLVIVVFSEGTPAAGSGGWPAKVMVEEKQITSAESMRMLVQARLTGNTDLPIELRGDRRLSYASVEPVLRACGAAGAMNIRLAVEQAQ